MTFYTSKCTGNIYVFVPSNEFRNFDKQCTYIEEILQPVKDLWLSDQLKQ